MSENPTSVLTKEILQYFATHPDAGDSIKGIALYWIKNQSYKYSIERIQSVLAVLEYRGTVVRIEMPDGSSFYRLRQSPAKRKMH